MLQKNVVVIETLNGEGTGCLYPCRKRGDYSEASISLLILTNSHVLGLIGTSEWDSEDLREDIKLQIYDDKGDKIPEKYIKEILVYNPEDVLEDENDIAALLVIMTSDVSLNIESKIENEDLNNRSIIFTEGYPGIMQEDKVSRKVQLAGVSKSIFPNNERVGVYQITDDYHWYEGLLDKRVLNGLSGSPVYIEKENETFLVGINQSVSNVYKGENPFKLIYYLKMEHIFKKLSKAGCIIYRKSSQTTYDIEWVYNLPKQSDEEKELTFLVIGSSGVGKSSFITGFGNHGKLIPAVNDGQTTRQNVIYEFFLTQKTPVAKVKLMDKDLFCTRMLEQMGTKGVLYFFSHVLEVSEELCKENSLIENSRGIATDEVFSRYDAMNLGQNTTKSLVKCYEILLEKIVDTIPLAFVKFICDRIYLYNFINEMLNTYNEKFKSEDRSNIDDNDEIWAKKIQENICIKITNNRFYDLLRPMIIEKCSAIIAEQMVQLTINKKIDFEQYQKRCYEAFCTISLHMDIKKINNRAFNEIINEEKFVESFIEEIQHLEGFFDLDEFEILDLHDPLKQVLEGIKHKQAKKISNEKNNSEKKVFSYSEDLKCLFKMWVSDEEEKKHCYDFHIWNFMKEVYEIIHEMLINILLEKKLIKENNFTMTFVLDNLSDERSFLFKRCLQVCDNKSLSGLVDNIQITDTISDDYAMTMSNLEVKKVTFVDTYGLDHVESNRKMENSLFDIYYRCDEQKIPLKDLAVLYVKKLDSGKPDELRSILPVVYKVLPEVPVYCVFTGIDIFYKTKEEIQTLDWSGKGRQTHPKAVDYIRNNKQEIIQGIIGSAERKTALYSVLRNNLIAYCGRKELMKKDYTIYKNNTEQIHRLWSSVAMREYNDMSIIDMNEWENVIENKRDIIEKLLLNIFQQASVNANNVHHRTLKADLSRIEVDGIMGYWGLYRHQWYQLFREAFNDVMTKNNGANELARETKTARALEAALQNMGSEFIGKSEILNKKNFKSNDQGSEFATILREMFATNIYPNNPYTDEKMNELDYGGKKTIYNDFFDFAKGLADENIKEKFVDLFIEASKKQITIENNEKSSYLLRVNESFIQELRRLKELFQDKYRDEENKALSFENIMRYYFEINKNDV